MGKERQLCFWDINLNLAPQQEYNLLGEGGGNFKPFPLPNLLVIENGPGFSFPPWIYLWEYGDDRVKPKRKFKPSQIGGSSFPCLTIFIRIKALRRVNFASSEMFFFKFMC
jgi:hypothetical protein